MIIPHMAKFLDPSSFCPSPLFYFYFNNDPLNYDPHDLPLNCKYKYILYWALGFDHSNQKSGFGNSTSLKATGAHTASFRNYVTLLARSKVVVK